MMSDIQSNRQELFDRDATVKHLAMVAVLITAVSILCGCSQSPQNESVFKVQSGDRTLVDVKKSPDENVSIDIDVPKVNLHVNQTPNAAPPPQPVTPEPQDY